MRAGVRFVNDSKATNPGAAARALEGFDARVIWIAGGRDKDLDFAALAEVAERLDRSVGSVNGLVDRALNRLSWILSRGADD